MTHRNYSDDWENSDWKKFLKVVFRLQRRIFKAVREDDTAKARRLQKLILTSHAARMLEHRFTHAKNYFLCYLANENIVFWEIPKCKNWTVFWILNRCSSDQTSNPIKHWEENGRDWWQKVSNVLRTVSKRLATSRSKRNSHPKKRWLNKTTKSLYNRR